MEFYKKDLVAEGGSIRIMPFSDIHYGNKNHNAKMFELYLKTALEEKDVYVLGLGDWMENANRRSVGYEDQIIAPMKQLRYLVKKFKPIADEGRMLGFIRGNHEMRSIREVNLDPAEWLAESLEIPYFADGIFMSLKIKNRGNKKRGQNYSLYAAHGYSGARTANGKLNACRRLAQMGEVDLYMMGHVHSLDSTKGYKYTITGRKLTDIIPTFVIAGHYLKYLGSYAQRMTIPPSGPAGTPKIKLHSDMKRISVSL
jgi:UDP-2,3-diacylglucosamine pyrophosphatase LpxH